MPCRGIRSADHRPGPVGEGSRPEPPASAAMPARRRASPRTRCRSVSPAPTSSTSRWGPSPRSGGPSRSPAATSVMTPPAWPPAPPRPCTSAPTGSWTSTSASASAARRAWPPAPTTPSSSTLRTTAPRSATSAPTASTSALSRPACRLPDPGDPRRGLNDPTSAVLADREPLAGGGPPAREGDPAQGLLPGRPPGHARPPRRPPARRRHLSCGASSRGGHHQVGAGHPGRARTPRPPPCWPTTSPTRRPGTGGSASTPGPKGSPPGTWLVAVVLALVGTLEWTRRPGALGRPPRRRRLPGYHRRAADLGPRAPRALLLHLHEAPVAVAGWFGAGSSLAPTARSSALHLVASAARDHRHRCRSWPPPGIPLAVMTAVYTAYLFAQAKARDLWQNPLLPPHMAVQAVLAGAAALVRRRRRRTAAPSRHWLDSGRRLRRPPPHGGRRGHPDPSHRPCPPRRPGDDPRTLRRFFWTGVILVAAGLLARSRTGRRRRWPPWPASWPTSTPTSRPASPFRSPRSERDPARVRCRPSLGERVSAARQEVEARGETFYPGASRIHLAAFPPKERWDDWVELDSRAWPRAGREALHARAHHLFQL